MKVFLSSTYLDLIEHRKAVVHELYTLEEHGIPIEIFGEGDEEPTKASLMELNQCDIFVGIYAYRYGSVPDGSSNSITEQEYTHAKNKGKPLFCYVVDDNHPWPRKLMDGDTAKIDTLKAKITADNIVDFFTTPDNLASKALSKVGNYITNFYRKWGALGSKLHPAENIYEHVTKDIQKISGCDIATLFVYDEKTKNFTLVEATGVRNSTSLELLNEINRDSPARRIVELGQPYYHFAENAMEDKLLQDEFINKEAVHSVLGIQLRHQDERVGVIFLNYRALHRFSIYEIQQTLLFANQVAITINTKRIYENQEKRSETFRGLWLNLLEKRLNVLNVFVLMPFADKYRAFYEDVIKNTIESMNFACKRADDFFHSSIIMNDIMRCIREADIIIADFSGRSPNVFFEVGIAHALEKNVILITQDLQDVPPKLQIIRCHIYKDDLKSSKEFPSVLKKAIQEVQGRNHTIFATKVKGKRRAPACLALMPSTEEGERTYNDLVFDVASSLEMECGKTNEIFDSNSVLDQIWDQINNSKIIIADLTDRDPDVFYLAGLAFGLNKKIVFMAQREEDIPFDIKKVSSLIYSLKPYSAGKIAQDKLAQIIKNLS